MRQDVSTTDLELTPRALSLRLAFTPDRAAAGIAFHLVDEKMALAVEERSIEYTRLRLIADKFSPTIKRELWEGMSNRERLDWLLTRSKTIVLMMPDGTARLDKKRSWL